MNCIVYMDLFFLLNFWLNALVLFLVRRLTKTYRTLWCLAAAAFGALGTCGTLAVYLIYEEYRILIAAVLLNGIMMNLLAFGRKNLLWHTFLFYVTGAVIAGFFTFFFTMQNSVSGKEELIILLVSVTAGIFCFFLEKECRVRWKEEHMKAKTVLEFGERKIFATALMDTGNRLYDPFYHKPVILVDGRIMKDFLRYCKENHPERMQYIPFQSVGKEHGLLEGVMLDTVKISWQEKTLQFSDVIAASTKENLYRNKEYQVIFHCGLLYGE